MEREGKLPSSDLVTVTVATAIQSYHFPCQHILKWRKAGTNFHPATQSLSLWPQPSRATTCPVNAF